jgi:hypothetical protein
MRTKDEEARDLAERHYEVEDGILEIYRITDRVEIESREDETIKLLEVNEGTVPAGIMPIHFGPAPEFGFHYSSVIIEVTPEEFQQLEANELQLPNSWTIGDLIPKPVHLSRINS